MGPWAATIGGILMVNGFSDFLANYSTTTAIADPIREALGILAFNAGTEFLRPGELAIIAVTQGLGKTLLPGVDQKNEPASRMAMGKALAPFIGETFTARTATEQMTYQLKRQQSRFGEPYPHFRYAFEEVSRQPVTGDAVCGFVLEEEYARPDVTVCTLVDAGLSQ